MNPELTAEARQIWAELEDGAKTAILKAVWCNICLRFVTMLSARGTVEHGDLLLRGTCSSCGGEVARLVEAS